MTDRITNKDRAKLFGRPCTPANHRLYQTPWGINVQVHKLIAARFSAACVVAHRESRWVPKRIDGYNCRPIRGSDDPNNHSIHSWALAWDFFATGPGIPPPGGVWTPDNPPDSKFVAAFVSLGFVWGGSFYRRDTPHIEWCAGLPAPIKPPTPKQEESMGRVPNVAGFTVTGEDNLIVCTTDGAIYAFNAQGGSVNAGYIDAVNQHPELMEGSERRFIGVYCIDEHGRPDLSGRGYCQVADDGARYRWIRPA